MAIPSARATDSLGSARYCRLAFCLASVPLAVWTAVADRPVNSGGGNPIWF